MKCFYYRSVSKEALTDAKFDLLSMMLEDAKKELVAQIRRMNLTPIGDTFKYYLAKGWVIKDGISQEIPGELCEPGRDNCDYYHYVYSMNSTEVLKFQ